MHVMSESQTAADDGTELTINGDASDVARLEARRIFEHTDYNVTLSSGYVETIAVWWDSDEEECTEWRGSYSATAIQAVVDSPASVELYDTKPDTRGVEFTVRGDLDD